MTRRRALIAPDPTTDPQAHKFAPVTYQPPTRSEPSAQEAKPGWIWVRVNDQIVQVPLRILEELERQHAAEAAREADLDNPLLRTLPRGPDDPNPSFDELRLEPTRLTTPDPSAPEERAPPNTFVLIRKPDGQTLRIPMLMVQRVLGLGLHRAGEACHPRCGAAGVRAGRWVLCEARWSWPTWRLVRSNLLLLAGRAAQLRAPHAAALLRRAAVEISIKVDDRGGVSVSGPPGAPPASPTAPALDVEAKRREIGDVFDKVVAEKGGPGQQGHFWTDGERVVYVSKAFLWALQDDPHMGLRVPPQLSGAVIAANLTDRFFGQAGVDWMNHHVPLAEWKMFRRVDRGTAERMILDRAIRQAPTVAVAAEILRVGQGPRWAAPDLSSEIRAMERAAEDLGISPGALLSACRSGKLYELGDTAWERLGNSRSWACSTLSGARQAVGDQADRDFDHVIAAFWAGARLGAPIVLMQPDGTPYLVSGDSRLMAARAFGLRPRVFVVRWPEGVVSTKRRNVGTSGPRVDPVDRSLSPAAGADRLPGGKGDHLGPADVDPTQLGKGIQHELEHTKDPALAQEIALDHLAEDPNYYSKLDLIEGRSRISLRTAIVKPCRKEDAEPGKPVCLYSRDGDLLGRHEDEAHAYAQEAAIQHRKSGLAVPTAGGQGHKITLDLPARQAELVGLPSGGTARTRFDGRELAFPNGRKLPLGARELDLLRRQGAKAGDEVEVWLSVYPSFGAAVALLDRAADALEQMGHNDLAERADRISNLMIIAAGTGTKEPGGPPVSFDDRTPQEAVFPPETLGPARVNQRAPKAPRS